MSKSENQYCRFCGVLQPSSEIRDLTSFTETLETVKKILKFLENNFVDFSDNALPNTICWGCYYNLNNCYIVFNNIKLSQAVLSNIFGNVGTVGSIERNVQKKPNNEESSGDELFPNLQIDESHGDKSVHTLALEGCRRASWTTYPYICLICKIKCKNNVVLKDHCLATHGMFNGYQCADCMIAITTFHEFIDHVRNHRPELIRYCPICDIRTDDSKHVDSHPESSIDQILHRTKTSEHIGRSKTETNMGDRVCCGFKMVDRPAVKSWNEYPWVCQLCDKVFQDQAILRIHLKEVHSKCFGFKCMDCTSVLSSFDEFIKHVTCHRPNLENKCEYCDFEITKTNKYAKHVNEHRLDYKCSVCGEFFHDITVLHIHKYMYNDGKTQNTPPNLAKESSAVEDVSCNTCSVACSRSQTLRKQQITACDQQKKFKCDQCGITYYHKNNLAVHYLTHQKDNKYNCEMCNSTFLTKRKLNNHRSTHFTEKRFECDRCHKKFQFKNCLTSHMITHSDEKPYCCHVCDKKFKYKHVMVSHQRTHSKVACPICNKLFVNYDGSNKHILEEHGAIVSKYAPKNKPDNPVNEITKNIINKDVLKAWESKLAQGNKTKQSKD